MNQLIKKMAIEAIEAMQPVEIFEAEIVSPSPDVEMKIKSNSGLVIPTELIIVPEHLTHHKRQIRVNNGAIQEYEFMDELKNGDQVMVASLQGGQSFFILDRY